ncbi:MerTP family mercury (Hg2+) permease, binding protein MerP [Neisseria shayeganii 871]|uniref:MerTP family mercury (Hg2+) permease, binding protein MerP n=2 Tax=Neisseria shayeganii TaxID=607712 RepID=G4CEW1_9NEIS|nr:MerTP family mercury (Hg2+) permease, binding protein MerP [Neisseria shayeganii 871]
MMQTSTLNIEGMTCGGCAKSVAKILQAVPGVQQADVSYEQKQAVVTFDPAATSEQALIEAVEDGGFDVV